jgi:uncharacterized protein
MGLEEIYAAAREGAADACYDLGLRFSAGDGVEFDRIEAHKWFNLAVMAGVEEARSYRAELASEMSAAEVASAQRKAREWLAGQTRH